MSITLGEISAPGSILLGAVEFQHKKRKPVFPSNICEQHHKKLIRGTYLPFETILRTPNLPSTDERGVTKRPDPVIHKLQYIQKSLQEPNIRSKSRISVYKRIYKRQSQPPLSL